jgi:hypothetical protein
MHTRGGKRRPNSHGTRVVRGALSDVTDFAPCPGGCDHTTWQGRWCAPCCFAPDKLLSKLREAMEALERHRAPEDERLVADLHRLTTDALTHAAMRKETPDAR